MNKGLKIDNLRGIADSVTNDETFEAFRLSMLGQHTEISREEFFDLYIRALKKYMDYLYKR